MSTYIVLLGPPGAGKGTQAEKICASMNLPHISTGDLFRENIRNETPLGKEVKKYLDSGALVPDETTIAIVRDRLSKDDCTEGALLDGFPRTSAQALALDEMLRDTFLSSVKVVPCIEVAKENLIERICGRRVCPSGHVFHVKFNPSAKEGVCDTCGGELIQRADDTEETIAKRVELYEAQTAPLIEYYEKKGVLQKVDGAKGIDEVTADILKIVKG